MLINKNKYIAMLIVSILLVGSLLAGCGNKETVNKETPKTTAQKPTEYAIGLAVPTSGGSAQIGIDYVDGVKLAVDEINKSGGVDGVPLKLYTEDSLATAEGGINAFNKLAQINKTPVIMSAWSAVVKAMAPLAAQSKVLLMNSGANAPDLSGASAFIVNAYPLASVDAPVSATYAYSTMNKRKVAILYINNATGIGGAKIYKETFEKLGGQVVAYESVEPNAIDVSTQVAKVKAANPDLIYLQLLIPETVVAVKKIKEMGLGAPVTTYGIGELADVRNPTKEAMNGVIFPQMIGGTNAASSEFGAKFKTAYGRAVSSISYVSHFYDKPYLIKEAILYMNKKGWEYNGENLKKAILEIKTFNLPLTGKMVFDQKGDISKSIKMKRIDDWNDAKKDVELATFEAK